MYGVNGSHPTKSHNAYNVLQNPKKRISLVYARTSRTKANKMADFNNLVFTRANHTGSGDSIAHELSAKI